MTSSALGSLFSSHESLGAWYTPVFLDPGTVMERAVDSKARTEILRVLRRLTPDAYSVYITAMLTEGWRKFGRSWRYVDILNILWASASLIQPKRYLEIGVRRGRSMSMVTAAAPSCSLLAFDLWVHPYAGIDNPGPEFVESEIRRITPRAKMEFFGGDSRVTIPEFFRSDTQGPIDLVTVDGDHSDEGARADLDNVLPHVSVGGAVVFDDIAHPAHPNLRNVWLSALDAAPGRFVHAAYTDLGYGVGFAIRVE